MDKLTFDWNLKDIFEKEELASEQFENMKKDYAKLVEFKGKLKGREELLKYFEYNSFLSEKYSKLFAYIQLRLSLDGKDEFANQMQEKISYYFNDFEPKIAFIEPEICANSLRDLKLWQKQKEFEKYEIVLDNLISKKKHSLDQKTNKLLSSIPSFGACSEAFDKFDNVDIKFGEVETGEGKKNLTPALYSLLLENPSQQIRSEAYDTMHKAYADHNFLLSSLYLSQTKENNFFVEIRKYKSELDSACESIKVDPKIVPTLFKVVRDHLHLFYRFEKIKKRALKLQDYYYFDNYATVCKENHRYDYKEGAKLMLEALNVYGMDYVSTMKKALTENWIDVYEKESKTTGGFSLGVYGMHPYILLNWGNTFSDVVTLCHEMGHTMHSYYSNKFQPLEKSDYSIFVAEVASTVNENLLNLYMLQNAKTKQEKLFHVHNFLHRFYGSVYRQTMFEEFEHFVITSVERKEPLSAQDLNKKYESLQKLYFGEDALCTEFSKYEWSRIPHFYSPYYVYKYATGFIAATIIARNIFDQKEGYLEKYMNFLKAGCSVYPLDLLKSVEVDLMDEKTLEKGFEVYEEYLAEFENLTKED